MDSPFLVCSYSNKMKYHLKDALFITYIPIKHFPDLADSALFILCLSFLCFFRMLVFYGTTKLNMILYKIQERAI